MALDTLVPPTRRLRGLLAEPAGIALPGCFDALSARLIEEAGFVGGAISGFAVETAHLGQPDIGLITQTEIADQARRIADAVDIPLICDADTGFGGVQNVYRTVRMMEKAGVAGIHIEDQAFPKTCPALPGRRLVSCEEAAGRFAAAAEARTDSDFVIIARTDGDTESYDAQIARANAYLAAGADLVLPMLVEFDGQPVRAMPPDFYMELIARIVRDIDGGVVVTGRPPAGYTSADVLALGVRIHSDSLLTLDAAAAAMRATLAHYARTGSGIDLDAAYPGRPATARALLDLMHLDRYLELEKKHAPAAS